MIRKTLAVAVLALVLAVPMANAIVSISWFTSTGFYGPSGSPNPLLNLNDSTLVQLINAGANGIIDAAVQGGSFLGGDDTLLTSEVFQNTTNNGDDEFLAGHNFTTYTQAFAPFNFYARVFQDDTPTGGEFYYNSAVYATQDKTQPDTQGVDINTLTPDDRDTPTQIIPVPEPSVLAFLGIGALLLGVRRIRRS